MPTVAAMLLIVGLRAAAQDTGAPTHGQDSDGDGWIDDVDCGPFNVDLYPGAPEVCDFIDNDCDLAVDEDAACQGCKRHRAYAETLRDGADSGGGAWVLVPLLWPLWRRRQGGAAGASVRRGGR